MGNETSSRQWLKRNKRSLCTAGTAAVILIIVATGALLDRFLRKVSETLFPHNFASVLFSAGIF